MDVNRSTTFNTKERMKEELIQINQDADVFWLSEVISMLAENKDFVGAQKGKLIQNDVPEMMRELSEHLLPMGYRPTMIVTGSQHHPDITHHNPLIVCKKIKKQ